MEKNSINEAYTIINQYGAVMVNKGNGLFSLASELPYSISEIKKAFILILMYLERERKDNKIDDIELLKEHNILKIGYCQLSSFLDEYEYKVTTTFIENLGEAVNHLDYLKNFKEPSISEGEIYLKILKEKQEYYKKLLEEFESIIDQISKFI